LRGTPCAVPSAPIPSRRHCRARGDQVRDAYERFESKRARLTPAGGATDHGPQRLTAPGWPSVPASTGEQFPRATKYSHCVDVVHAGKAPAGHPGPASQYPLTGHFPGDRYKRARGVTNTARCPSLAPSHAAYDARPMDSSCRQHQLPGQSSGPSQAKYSPGHPTVL
jgi:hypothetical protein